LTEFANVSMNLICSTISLCYYLFRCHIFYLKNSVLTGRTPRPTPAHPSLYPLLRLRLLLTTSPVLKPPPSLPWLTMVPLQQHPLLQLMTRRGACNMMCGWPAVMGLVLQRNDWTTGWWPVTTKTGVQEAYEEFTILVSSGIGFVSMILWIRDFFSMYGPCQNSIFTVFSHFLFFLFSCVKWLLSVLHGPDRSLLSVPFSLSGVRSPRSRPPAYPPSSTQDWWCDSASFLASP
jgi:hypothetical protein